MHLSVTLSGMGFGLCQIMSLSQIPTVGLERQGDTPRNSDDVLVFQSVTIAGVLEQRTILGRGVLHSFFLLPSRITTSIPRERDRSTTDPQRSMVGRGTAHRTCRIGSATEQIWAECFR